MRYLSLLLKIAVFVVLLSFALQNTAMVTLNGFFEYQWQAPLIVIMLVCFVIGALSGVMASLTYVIRLRRALTVARKHLKTSKPTKNPSREPILEPPRDAV